MSRDGLADGQRALAIGHDRGQRRLVGDERAHVLRVGRDEGQRIDRAAAAGEQVDRRRAELGDEPMQVVGVLLPGVDWLLGSALTLRSTPRGS